nr:MAG TPA: hypothetical protein [Caudoviricetes sp.]
MYCSTICSKLQYKKNRGKISLKTTFYFIKSL